MTRAAAPRPSSLLKSVTGRQTKSQHIESILVLFYLLIAYIYTYIHTYIQSERLYTTTRADIATQAHSVPMRLLRHLVPALFLALLALATVRATSCGEGGDGSVANCCYDYDGVCDVCAEGYGRSDDGRKCVKCNVKNCLYCDGNPNICDQVKEPPVRV